MHQRHRTDCPNTRALLLDPVLDLDRELDAEADEDRQAGDRHQRQLGAGESECTEAPDDADHHPDERQETPSDLESNEQHHHHHQHGDPAEHQHPTLQVVVDVGQERRCAGDRDGCVFEGPILEYVVDSSRSFGQRIERRVADEHRCQDGVSCIGDESL